MLTNEKDINRYFVRRHLVRPPGTDKQAEAWAQALPDATTRLASVSEKYRQVTLVFPWGYARAPMADFEREWVAMDEWLAPHVHNFGPWEGDPTGAIRRCECGAMTGSPEG